MRELLAVFVPGKPESKGSAKAFYRPGMRFPVVVNDNVKAKTWAGVITTLALAHRVSTVPTAAAVNVALRFRFARPKSHFGAHGFLKPSAPKRHTQKPDLDKVTRCLLDALTSVVFVDDSQVVSFDGTGKRWCELGEEMGVHITVTELD